jgi:hypothetical protein
MPTDPNRPDPANIQRRPDAHPASEKPSEPAEEDVAPAPKAVHKPGPMVIAPAVCLILLGLWNLLAGLGTVGLGYLVLNKNAGEFVSEFDKNPQNKENLKKANIDINSLQLYTTIGCFVTGIITAILAFPVLFAGTGMLRGRGWGGAVFGSLVAIIAPGSGCLLGLIVGIWALVVLFNKDVRAAFR